MFAIVISITFMNKLTIKLCAVEMWESQFSATKHSSIIDILHDSLVMTNQLTDEREREDEK